MLRDLAYVERLTARHIDMTSPEVPGFTRSPVGTLVRDGYLERGPWYLTRGLPRNDTMFEWLDLFEAIEAARETFTMIELGAGFGARLVAGAIAAQRCGLTTRLCAVEAEPTHFAWLREHFAHNGLKAEDHLLVKAAISGAKGDAWFVQGQATGWYGQSILPAADAPYGEVPATEVVKVPTITLASLLDRFDIVDHIDSDIQGAEGEVFIGSIEAMTAKVRRVHMETHWPEDEPRLREAFRAHGWVPTWDFPCSTKAVETPFGIWDFEGGVQGWINPRLA